MKRAASSGVLPMASVPSAARRSRIGGSRAMSTISRCTRAITVGGVRAGASNACQIVFSYPGTPASETVGTRGRYAARLLPVVAIAVVTVDSPPVNALGKEVLAGLASAAGELATSDARAVVLTGTGDKAFMAGADLKENGSYWQERFGSFNGWFGFEQMGELPHESLEVFH